MQQRLNNRWLSEQLIEAVRQHSTDKHDLASVKIEHDFAARAELQSTRQGHRRMWQHLATVLLLLGSAAFSYLAWSQVEQGHDLPHSSNRPITSQDTLIADRLNVRDLRVANRELQLRIAELQEATKQAAP